MAGLSLDGRTRTCALLRGSGRLVVLDPGWGQVDPDIVAVDACFAALFGESLINLGDALLFRAASDAFSDGADEHVFEVAECSAGFEEFEVGVNEFVDELCGEVVEG
ncbi:MAG: hypothetical protein RLZZ458_935 [Planctomycetota bacterium]